jgi:predicted MFS family arabinose efflux permease
LPTDSHELKHGTTLPTVFDMKATVYKGYLLTLLLTILAFNYADRLALGLVLQEIKRDLHLSDTQLGFLTGIAFALFYSLMGIPIARWADRGNRALIISLTTGAWSVMVALSGTATSFARLLLIRIGVAAGEAGCIPAAHSLIADYFTRAERPRAVAIYMLGSSFSVVPGYYLAGWLNQLYGWRMMFAILSLPGIALAALAWFSLREPRRASLTNDGNRGRGATVSNAAATSNHPNIKQVCATLWGNATFRHLLLCFAVVTFFGSGIGQWQPTFFVRTYGLKTGDLGTWFTLVAGGGGILGTYAGGVWASRHAASNERLQLKAMAILCSAFCAISACIYLSTSYYLAFALIGIGAAGLGTVIGPMFATIQTLVPPPMRAVSISVVFLASNLIGGGLGPLAVGALSDVLRPSVGEASLRYALLAMCPGYLWGGWHLWRASRTVSRDLQQRQTDSNHPDSPSQFAIDASPKPPVA